MVSLIQILGSNLGDQIEGLGEYAFVSNYINMFRSTVGDIQNPDFECKAEDNCVDTFVKIWVVFVVTVYIGTIILNNFLIAKVSSVYEEF